jgi:hypothetical protein
VDIDDVILWVFVFSAVVAAASAIGAAFGKVHTKLPDTAWRAFWVSAIVCVAAGVAIFLRMQN